MFDHEGPAVISAMYDLTVGVFEKLDIASPMDVDKILAYMQRILRGAELKKYLEVLVACRYSAKGLTGDEWTLGDLTGISAENL